MTFKFNKFTLCLLLFGCSIFSLELVAQTTIYDESVNGTLTSDPTLAPTLVTLVEAQNDVIGSFGAGESFDQFTFNVPVGSQVTGIILTDYPLIAGNATGSSFTLHLGATAPAVGVAGLGGASMENSNVNANLLGTGTIPATPLAPGDYTIRIEEGAGVNQAWALRIQATGLLATAPVISPASPPIPTLSQWGLLVFGLLVMNLGIFFVQQRELV